MAIMTFAGNVRNVQGKSGKMNYSKTQYGIEYKENPIRTKPSTPAQLAQQARLKKASTAFAGLTAPQNAAWQTYAQTRFVKSKSGADVHPSAYSAFVGLYTKLLQVNPAGTPPSTPPATEFAGDTVTVTIAGASGRINFTGNKANATNVVTELLIQPLRNIYRKPTGNYPSKAFFPFASGGLTTSLLLPAGAYAVAIRFVNSATGQETDKILLGSVSVS